MVEIRVFISCPDGLDELVVKLKERAREISDTSKLLGISIKVLYWSQNNFNKSNPGLIPQQIIFDQLGEYDLYFGFMKDKYGTPILEFGLKSGTEVEYLDAFERSMRSQLYKQPRLISFSFIKNDTIDEEVRNFKREVIYRNGIAIERDEDGLIKLFSDHVHECINTSPLVYSKPQDYSLDLSITDGIQNGFFDYQEKVNLEKLIIKEKRILIIGNGGSGKSTYLEYIAYLFSQDIKTYTPILIELGLYKNKPIQETIMDLIRSKPKNPLLLLDGFDELSEVSVFFKHIFSYLEENQNTPVVITSRPIDVSGIEINNFQKYYMQELDYDQIIKYWEEKGVKTEELENSHSWRDVLPLMRIPFYLVKIVNQYESKNNLPKNKSEIIENVLSEGMKQDKSHFLPTFNQDGEYDELDNLLQELAFLMVNSNQNYLSQPEIRDILSNDNLDSLIRKYTRVFEKNHGKYCFIHKIFMEYLAAKAIAQLDFETILNLIKYDNFEMIKYNWEASIPYLLEILHIDKRKNLISYLVQHQPKLLIEANHELLDINTQEIVFKSLFDIDTLSSSYHYGSGIDIRRLAKFWVTPDQKKYLVDIINNPGPDLTLVSEAFFLLAHRGSRSEDEDIEKLLISCLLDETYEPIFTSLVVLASECIEISSFEMKILDELYQRHTIKIIPLLTVYDKEHKFLNELIEFYFISQDKPPTVINSINDDIEDYFVSCFKSGISRTQFIDKAIEKNIYNEHIGIEERINEMVEFAISQKEPEEFFEDLYKLFTQAIKNCADKMVTSISHYFATIGRTREIVSRVFTEGKEEFYDYQLFTLDSVNNDFVEFACSDLWDTFNADRQHRLAKYIANSRFNPLYEKILKTKVKDFDKLKDNKDILEFNRFEKDMQMILSLEDIEADVDALFGDNSEISKDDFRLVDKYEFCTIIFDLVRRWSYSISSVNKADIVNHIKKNHEWMILKFLEQNYLKKKTNPFNDNGFDFMMTQDVQDWLDEWSNRLLGRISFRFIDYSKELNYQDLTYLRLLFRFAIHGLVELSDDAYLDYYSYDHAEDEVLRYIESHIPENTLRDRVLDNLDDKEKLEKYRLSDQIKYCYENNVAGVLSHVYEILGVIDTKFQNDYILHKVCIESILTFGEDHQFNVFIKSCSINHFIEITYGFIKKGYRSEELINRLKKEFKDVKKGSYNVFAYYLCCFGDFNGLKRYTQLIKEEKKIFLSYADVNPFLGSVNISSVHPMISLLDFYFTHDIEEGDCCLDIMILEGLKKIALEDRNRYDQVVVNLKGLLAIHKGNQEVQNIIRLALLKLEKEFPQKNLQFMSISESLKLYKELTNQ